MRQLPFVVILMLSTPLPAQGGYSFAGVGGGAIPDGQSATPEVSPRTPLAITFNVSGVVGTMPSTMATYLAEIAGGNNQLMVTTFASLSPAQINGSWTLLIQDVTQGDTGSVASAGLVIGTISASAGDGGGGEDDSACSTSERPGVTTVWALLLLVPLILLRVFQHGARGGQRTRCPKQQV